MKRDGDKIKFKNAAERRHITDILTAEKAFDEAIGILAKKLRVAHLGAYAVWKKMQDDGLYDPETEYVSFSPLDGVLTVKPL